MKLYNPTTVIMFPSRVGGYWNATSIIRRNNEFETIQRVGRYVRSTGSLAAEQIVHSSSYLKLAPFPNSFWQPLSFYVSYRW